MQLNVGVGSRNAELHVLIPVQVNAERPAQFCVFVVGSQGDRPGRKPNVHVVSGNPNVNRLGAGVAAQQLAVNWKLYTPGMLTPIREVLPGTSATALLRYVWLNTTG
jgi:hypothetical protein